MNTAFYIKTHQIKAFLLKKCLNKRVNIWQEVRQKKGGGITNTS
jgi:hypothetical protein